MKTLQGDRLALTQRMLCTAVGDRWLPHGVSWVSPGLLLFRGWKSCMGLSWWFHGAWDPRDGVCPVGDQMGRKLGGSGTGEDALSPIFLAWELLAL